MEKQPAGIKTQYKYTPSNDMITNNSYVYSGVKDDFIGVAAFILSVVNVCLSFFLYKIALFVGFFVIFAIRFQQRRYDSPAAPAAYCGAMISITISAFIWIVKIVIFGGA